MSPIEIIGLVLGSSLLSTIMSSFIEWRIQARNYKREYYKKLLEKRLDAYEAVESITREMGGLVHQDDGMLCPMIFGLGEDYWDRFFLQVMYASSKSFWLSNKTTEKLSELNIFLINSVSKELVNSVNRNDTLIQIGVTLREDIRIRRNEIIESLYRDFQSLSDISKFVETPRSDGTYILDQPINRAPRP